MSDGYIRFSHHVRLNHRDDEGNVGDAHSSPLLRTYDVHEWDREEEVVSAPRLMMERLLSDIDEKYVASLMLLMGGWSLREVGEQLGIAHTTVKRRAVRCLELVFEHFEEPAPWMRPLLADLTDEPVALGLVQVSSKPAGMLVGFEKVWDSITTLSEDDVLTDAFDTGNLPIPEQREVA